MKRKFEKQIDFLWKGIETEISEQFVYILVNSRSNLGYRSGLG